MVKELYMYCERVREKNWGPKALGNFEVRDRATEQVVSLADYELLYVELNQIPEPCEKLDTHQTTRQLVLGRAAAIGADAVLTRISGCVEKSTLELTNFYKLRGEKNE